jgi:hypothetical protein
MVRVSLMNGSRRDRVAQASQACKTKREIIRCLKRYVAREIYHLLTAQPTPEPSSMMSS